MAKRAKIFNTYLNEKKKICNTENKCLQNIMFSDNRKKFKNNLKDKEKNKTRNGCSNNCVLACNARLPP